MTDKADLQSRLLKESKVFCMLPWIQLNIDPKGAVYPCCMAEYSQQPVGSLRESRLSEIWNSEEMRMMRKNMLAGRKSSQCGECYRLEEFGVRSQRTMQNHYHGHLPVLEDTREDGSVVTFKLDKLSMQFTNLCNFRCRYCGCGSSSAWYHDAELMGEQPHQPRLLQAVDDPKDMVRQLEPLLSTMREIYFFGGEPLITDLVYQTLTMLIEREQFDFHLGFTTNFSVTTWKGMDMFDLWSRFETVRIGASLDAMGARGEYIRKGQKWDQVMRNRERMMKVCPNVKFVIQPTMSVFNVWHFPDFFADWVRRGYLEVDAIDPGFLLYREEYRMQILPAHLKRQITEKYEKCILEVCRPRGEAGIRAEGILRSVLTFLNDQDRTDLIPAFRERTRKMDQIRREKCAQTFPEFAEILR